MRCCTRDQLQRRTAILLVSSFSWAISAGGQATILTVIGTDSAPVPFAVVTTRGGVANIADQQGKLSLGALRKTLLSAQIRRIGYEPWIGTLQIPDTAVRLTVTLRPLAQQLSGVTVTGRGGKSSLELTGFYDRWLMRQKGALSATFIGPEEIEGRHPTRATDMLNGLVGISLKHLENGAMIAENSSGTCFMSVMVDGKTVCPQRGCHTSDATSQNSQKLSPITGYVPPIGEITVDINQTVDVNDVAAIEVYARGGNMPVSLQSADNACGVVAFWTGPRR